MRHSIPKVHRRAMLERSARFGHLAMSAMLFNKWRQVLMRATPPTRPAGPAEPHFVPRAKRVIFLFMKGGPSHVDTFDYKPQLQKDDGKELPLPNLGCSSQRPTNC